MSEDARDSEGHAREVAVRVADEDARRGPVVPQQAERDAEEGQRQVEREEVVVVQRAVGPAPNSLHR